MQVKLPVVAVIDLGVGNVGSIVNMLKRVGSIVRVGNDSSIFENATHIILPGVGNFDYVVDRLYSSKGLVEALDEFVLKRKIPTLGICVGMQVMFDGSEEGQRNGLGWMSGYFKRFKSTHNLRVPHMGWNFVDNNLSQIFTNIDFPRFYFVHSYYLNGAEGVAIGHTRYGEKFISAVNCHNIYGVQFHPEKSHKNGILLMSNFLSI